MKTLDIVERIEGEARLNLQWKNKKISQAQIEFLNFRGYEYILQNKPILDALVYNPRICGICGQAHLLSTVRALENLYEQAGVDLYVSPKAHILREFGLAVEILDSHIKWFYMFIMPDIVSLSKKNYESYTPLKGKKWLHANKVASETMKSLAIFSGQWPHTSYMIPGGVMSDPTLLDMATVENYVDQAILFFEQELCGVSLDRYLSFNDMGDFDEIQGDLKTLFELAHQHDLIHEGKSYDRHLVLGEDLNFVKGHIKNKKVCKVDASKIKESDEFTFDVMNTSQSSKKYGWSKTVQYAQNFFEVGPLSRALVQKRSFIKAIHSNHQDSVFTRIMARMDEMAYLLNHCKSLLKRLDISEESYIEPKVSIKEFENVKAHGMVEACRGSLFHEVHVNKGMIQTYDVITPTVWNLGPGSTQKPGVAQKAIIGLDSLPKAKIALRSFDVCSVCTTH
jgi:hydrogenase large subunit